MKKAVKAAKKKKGTGAAGKKGKAAAAAARKPSKAPAAAAATPAWPCCGPSATSTSPLRRLYIGKNTARELATGGTPYKAKHHDDVLAHQLTEFGDCVLPSGRRWTRRRWTPS